MNYRLIVIDGSLKEKSILTTYIILSETKFEAGTPEESTLYKIEIPESDIGNVSNFLKNNLKYRYYAHLYHEDPTRDTMIVVFGGQLFNSSKTHHEEAMEYGIHHGITERQMIITPKNVSEEKW